MQYRVKTLGRNTVVILLRGVSLCFKREVIMKVISDYLQSAANLLMASISVENLISFFFYLS